MTENLDAQTSSENDLSRRLTLASASPSRAALLSQVALEFDICPSHVDEASLKSQHKGAVKELALTLARAKASAVIRGGYVLGADQILVCEGRLFDKPPSMEKARDTLTFLSGRHHQLVNGVSLFQNGVEVWSFENSITLKMRDLSADYIDRYLHLEGEGLLASVGAYRLEGRGPLLFDHIDGDYFSILGLPLLPVLGALRSLGIVDA